MNKVLVTGGAGFIGSNLSNSLFNSGYKVYVIDDLSNGNEKFLKKGINLQVADVASKEALNFIKKVKPQYIVHLAAQSNLSLSLSNPKSDLERNFFPIIRLIETAIDINVKKFIFSSSAAVFGNANEMPVKEESTKEPTSPYGLSKLCSEYYLHLADKKFHLPYITLRFANVYGENQNSDTEGGVVAIFMSNIINGKESTIFGDGNQTRDFVYIKDVEDALFKSLNSKAIGDFNIGSSKETSVSGLFGIIKQVTQLKAPFRHEKNHDYGVSRNALSYSKAENELKWKPKTTLKDGLKSTMKYFKGISP